MKDNMRCIGFLLMLFLSTSIQSSEAFIHRIEDCDFTNISDRNEKMRVAILGIGAIGSYVAAMIARNTKYELYLLARSNFSIISKHGIIVEESVENASWETDRYTVTDDISTLPKCDFIILTVKESQLDSLLPKLEMLCHAKTKIICLQNGLNFEERIQQVIPSHALYSGTCWIKATKLSPNSIRHDFGKKIKLGKFSPNSFAVPITSADRNVRELLENALLECDLEENVKEIQLTKLTLNVPFFVLMAREGKTPSEILSDESLDKEREKLQQEIMDSSIRYGFSLDLNFLSETIANLRKLPITAPSSREQLAITMTKELPGNVETLLHFMNSRNTPLNNLERVYSTIINRQSNLAPNLLDTQ